MTSSVVERDRRAFADYCAEVDAYEAKRLSSTLHARNHRLLAIRPILTGNHPVDPTLNLVDAACLANMLLMPGALELIRVAQRSSSEEAVIEYWVRHVCVVLSLATTLDCLWETDGALPLRIVEVATTVLHELVETAEELQRALRLFVIRWTPRYPNVRRSCVRPCDLNPAYVKALGIKAARLQRERFDFLTLELRAQK